MAGAANGSLGVAVARFGDDASVIFPRQGLVASPPIKVRHIDGTQGTGLVARKWQDWQADACFIDKGGFGSSWIDNLRRLGREPVGIAFSGRAADPRYDNRRTKMYFEAVDWIRKGGALPPGEASRELIAALSRTTYSSARRPAAARAEGPGEGAAGVFAGRCGCVRADVCAADGGTAVVLGSDDGAAAMRRRCGRASDYGV